MPESAGGARGGFQQPWWQQRQPERLALRVVYDDAGQRAGLPTDLFTKEGAKVSQRLLTGGAGMLHGEEHFYMSLRDKTTMEAPLGY